MSKPLPQIFAEQLAEVQPTFSLTFMKQDKERFKRFGQEIPESVCTLTLFAGRLSVYSGEVREYHGKGYSLSKKKEMRAALLDLRNAIEQALAPIIEEVDAMPSEPDEHESAKK